MRTKVIQSFREYNIPIWLQKCMLSVKDWARYYGYDYEFMGDEFFNFTPNWCKVEDKWVITNICRLIWLKKETKYYDRVIWADADFIIFNKNLAQLGTETHGFSYEHFGLNNAFMYFNKGDIVLDTYYEMSKNALLHDSLTRTLIGPELLRKINKIKSLNILKFCGLLYRPLTTQLLQGYGYELDDFVSKLPAQIAGANMCNFVRDLSHHSNDTIFTDIEFLKVVDLLLATEGARLNTKWEK